MKKLVLTTLASLACVAAFAQGKISFQNDSLHLAYWVGGSFNGLGVNSDRMDANLLAQGGGLSVDLYMGTSSSQLFLYSSTTFGTIAAGEGKWTSTSVLANPNATTGAPLINGGTTVFVEVQIRDANKAAPNIFTGDRGSDYAYGASSMFTFTLGSGITYPVMWGAQGNWPVGGFNMDSSSYGAGARGAIGVVIVPEPTSAALAGLGAAAMLIFRRRK
jgi:hypothetical protein